MIILGKAIERGETIPDGVYLIGFRDPTPDEVSYGLALTDIAKELLGE